MSRMQDPFVDPTNPFGEQSGRYGPQNGHAAANSRSDLLASGQDPEKAMEPALVSILYCCVTLEFTSAFTGEPLRQDRQRALFLVSR
jgi:hypothetical protein